MVDIKKFTEQLVSTGMDKTKAAAKIKAVIAKIKEEKGDIPDAEIESLIGFALSKIASRKGEKYKGICIGYDSKRDQNKPYADATLSYFNAAATKQRVVIVDENSTGYTVEQNGIKTTYGVQIKNVDGADVAVPLDMREFIDTNKKFKNNGYRKPLRSFYKRRCYFIIDNEIAFVTGNIDPIAGAEYYIYGKKVDVKGRAFINVGKSGIQKAASLTAVEVWDAIYKFAEKSEFAIPLEDVASIAPFEVKLTTGFVKNGGDTKKGGRWIVLNNDVLQQGQFGLSANDDAVAAMQMAQVGNEVFALVRGMKEDPSRESTAVNVLSLVVNPESASNADLIGDLEVFIEGD